MSTAFKSIPHDNAIDVHRHGHGLILTEFEVSRLTTALQGIHAITAVLQQREIDAEMENGEGLIFGPHVARGLIAALATCTEYVQDTVETGGVLGERAEHDSAGYEHLDDARWRVLDANRKGAKE